MTISKIRENDMLTVAVEGRLDAVTSPELEEVLDESLGGVKTLVFDFKDLEYISSAGLRVLISAMQSMTGQGGSLSVINASQEVLNIFDITGLSDILGIVQEG